MCAVTANTGSGCAHRSAIINTYDYAEEALYFSRLAEVIGNGTDATKYRTVYENAKQAIYNIFGINHRMHLSMLKLEMVYHSQLHKHCH